MRGYYWSPDGLSWGGAPGYHIDTYTQTIMYECTLLLQYYTSKGEYLPLSLIISSRDNFCTKRAHSVNQFAIATSEGNMSGLCDSQLVLVFFCHLMAKH